MVSGKKVAGAIRSLVNVRCLKLQLERVLHDAGIVRSILIYGSKTMV